jgi:hypothetical protein
MCFPYDEAVNLQEIAQRVTPFPADQGFSLGYRVLSSQTATPTDFVLRKPYLVSQ